MKTQIIFGLLLLTASNSFAADISQQHRIQVLVKESVLGNEYNDAIYYTPEQWATVKQADVTAEITKRTDNFRSVLENPAPAVEPTKEQLEAEKSSLESRIIYLNEEIAKK